jgi:hypothetical protein
VILLVAVIAGLAATYLRALLSKRHLRTIDLRFSWLVFLAVIPQLLVFQVQATARLVPEEAIPFILVFSQILLLIFVGANFRRPGFWALSMGLLVNFLAIGLNGGWMPISPETIQRMFPSLPPETWIAGERLGFTKDRIMAVSSTRLAWLADVFTLPTWISYRVAFSVGDIFIAVGAFLILWSLSNPIEKELK